MPPAVFSSQVRALLLSCPRSFHSSRSKVLDELQGDPFLLGGECGETAHGALRIAYQDAIGFSQSEHMYVYLSFRRKALIVTLTLSGGGADGSIIVFNSTELGFHTNVGIDDILDTFSNSIHAHPEITPGD
jgi:manganese peroxidase